MFLEAQELKTFSPVHSSDTNRYLEGQLWPRETKDPYDRFPARAENIVRKVVWDLSTSTAGEQVRFRTNAQKIVVKYQVKGNLQMPHMPATGVSGVDLYARDQDGNWRWCHGPYSFKDTIQYAFNMTNAQGKALEYTLYLPLYNSVSWMTIQVADSCTFDPLPVRTEKPIVVYGTSIAQGACASRPGMAWTNILSRKLDFPVANLAFSGNGRLEPEVVALLSEIDARLFILDCLPNLTNLSYTTAILKNKIVQTIHDLRKKHPEVPILLTDHDGYTDGDSNTERKIAYERVNTIQHQVFDSLTQQAGLQKLYYLEREAIGQDIESMVDGTHPNDIGMMHYADAYTKKINEIFQQHDDTLVTCIPKTQYRDAPLYFWTDRHQAILKLNQRYQPHLVLIGNSITHFWGGLPIGPARGKDSWSKYIDQYRPLNLGFGWDKIENALWRIYHDELQGISPKYIVVMLGVNNLGTNTDNEIKRGMENLLQAIHVRQPKARLLLMGILPCKDREERVSKLNQQYQQLAQQLQISFADAGPLFLQKDGRIKESLFSDGLHPNAEGYALLGKFITRNLP
ncbi:SGNH/GDSL hydrolase family protein [Olivibacter ginsenosidimutans]|uniref:SGNH/GDSL hydrolase family protein n=2 Tax=Olivibacter ginsenosidimutans TaxID=1176537 RepID=A0ABP9BFW1_9SPHI